ncbi:MAG: hypothetical protein AAF745_13340 [Planctomycetota bacterium]
MHERTMRSIARWLFVLCCAMPTVLTCLAIIATATPTYSRIQINHIRQELSLRTGLGFEIKDLDRISPSESILHGVKLVDPETNATIGTIRVVQFLRDDHETIIRLSQPELLANHLNRLWMCLHDRFLAVPEQTDSPWRITASDVTLRSGGQSLTLRDVAGWLQPSDDGVAAVLQGLPANATPGGEAISLQIERHRSGGLPQTSWSLQTNGRDISLAPLSGYLTELQALGADATYRGQMVVSEMPATHGTRWHRHRRWSIDLSGSTLSDIDLSKLGEQLPHRISGLATLRLDGCRLEDGALVDAFGTLHSANGQFSSSLIRGLQSHLQMRAPENLASSMPYDQMALRFEFYASQLRVDGICDRQRGYETLPASTVATVAGRELIRSSDVL